MFGALESPPGDQDSGGDSRYALNPIEQSSDTVVEKLAISKGGSLQFHYKDIPTAVGANRASRASRF
jgi:hypothetical protein